MCLINYWFNVQIHQLSFSPHTDAKGITDLIKFLSPKHVILVHGEKPKMESLKGKFESEFRIQCYVPANNETVSIPSAHYVKAEASSTFLRSTYSPNFKFLRSNFKVKSKLNVVDMSDEPLLRACDDRVAEGILTTQSVQNPKIVHQNDLEIFAEEKIHEVQFAICLPVEVANVDENTEVAPPPQEEGSQTANKRFWLHQLVLKLSEEFPEMTVLDYEEHLQVESFVVSVCFKNKCPYRRTAGTQNTPDLQTIYFCCMWSTEDKDLAWKVISVMKNIELRSVL